MKIFVVQDADTNDIHEAFESRNDAQRYIDRYNKEVNDKLDPRYYRLQFKIYETQYHPEECGQQVGYSEGVACNRLKDHVGCHAKTF